MQREWQNCIKQSMDFYQVGPTCVRERTSIARGKKTWPGLLQFHRTNALAQAGACLRLHAPARTHGHQGGALKPCLSPFWYP